MQKITELDIKAHYLYVRSRTLGNSKFYREFNVFYSCKENYEQYYIEAKIELKKEKNELRKQKINNLNKICSKN